MQSRQEKIFKAIIEEYIQSAIPIGSKLIVDKYLPDVSSATIRHEMVKLEEQGYIFQPHTSAGRIPTEAGYLKYIQENVNLNKKDNQTGSKQTIKINSVSEQQIKDFAKHIAEVSGLAVLVGFAPRNIFYTGLSNLFSQPEFNNLNLIFDVSKVLDHLDEVVANIYNKISAMQIKVGRENPFSNDCSVVMIKKEKLLFGILGPMRMDYKKAVSLLNLIK